ncbi:hypothetical protein HDU79_011227 [Rhizoclosmatium sp. JEL0117]|nr:hypothetical protein HDU79_011227 [Rhizoclosmatium sp. JEL0117]
MAEFLALEQYIVQSEVDSIAGSIKVTVVDADSSQAWIGTVSHRDVLEAAESAEYSDKYEDFIKLIQNALSGSLDSQGRQTECSVQSTAKGTKRLDLKVFPTGNHDLEFEILSIKLSKHLNPHHQVSCTLLKYLIEDRVKLHSKVRSLETAQAILIRDLNQSRQSFTEWSTQKKEQYEMDMFKKFKDLLNTKKHKIRELMEALEISEAKVKELLEKKDKQADGEPEVKHSPDEPAPTSPIIPPPKAQGSKRQRSNSPTRRNVVPKKDVSDDDDDAPPPLLLGNKKR